MKLSSLPKLGLAVLFGLIATSPLQATVSVDATQVGRFYEDGTVDNSATFQNYFVGYSSLAGSKISRNFFFFDLSGVATPVVSVDFSLVLPFGGLISGGDGMGGFEVEDFILSGTPYDSSTVLDTMIDPGPAMMVWDTFGDPMDLIGGTTFDPLMPPIVPTAGLEIIIPLDPAGIDLINANLGGEVILTGRMLDVSKFVPGPEKSELIFGLSDIVDSGGMETSLPKPFLDLTLIPEPSSALLGMLGMVALILRRWR